MDAEFRKDLEHARTWRLEMERPDGAGDDLADARRRRKAVEAIRTKGVMTAVGVIATGVLGALFVGLQHLFSRGQWNFAARRRSARARQAAASNSRLGLRPRAGVATGMD